jgi:hypothetical protein
MKLCFSLQSEIHARSPQSSCHRAQGEVCFDFLRAKSNAAEEQPLAGCRPVSLWLQGGYV